MKPFIKIVVVLFLSFFIFSSCEKDLENISITKETVTKTVSFKEFIGQTKMKDFETIFRLPVANSDISRSTNLTDYIIDTLFINQHIYGSNKSTYTFQVYPKTARPLPDENYNLVYRKVNNNWEKTLVHFTIQKVGLRSQINNLETIYDSREATLCYGVTPSFHCTRTGDCTESYCDGCGHCATWTVHSIPCPGAGAGSADPSFSGPFNGGGGNSSDPFSFAPNTYDNPEFNNLNFVNPCQNLIDKTNTNAFMAKFNSINKPANFVMAVETGFIEKSVNGTTVYVDGIPDGNASLSIPPETKAFVHVHNNKPKINEAGESFDAAVKMQSPEDLAALIVKCKNNSGTMPQDAYGIMISNDAIYSLNILDGNIDMGMVNANWAKFKQVYFEKCEEIIPDTSISLDERNEILQIMMLEGLKTLGLETKVGLFQGNVETTTNGSKTIKWTRKTISPTKTLLKQPC